MLLYTGMFCRETSGAEREWYELTIDHNRVGYAWHEQGEELEHQRDSEVMPIEATQLRRRVSIETSAEAIRDAAGLPVELVVGSRRRQQDRMAAVQTIIG